MRFGSPASLSGQGVLILIAILFPVTYACADSEAKVFPVKGFFYDSGNSSPLDPRFRAMVGVEIPQLSDKIYQALTAAFKDKVGPLDRLTAGHTFAVSFQVTRATAYSVDKGNGNSDLVASVTASLYFTNVVTGEILNTVSHTLVSRSLIANNAQFDPEIEKLFKNSLDSLIVDLVTKAALTFSPTLVKATITDQIDNLLIIDAGYSKGIQSGDSLSDNAGELIQVIYSSKEYSVAQRILADKAVPGVVFDMYLSHTSDGRDKPRTAVLVDDVPSDLPKQYVAVLFSDLLGYKAPLSVMQINPSFNLLLRTVVQQASLSSNDIANRRVPNLFIRLRIAEPIIYEAATNLNFTTIRHVETLAFADIVDGSGRIVYSALGRDVIQENVIGQIKVDESNRREVSIKNALNDLAGKLATLGTPQRQQNALIPVLAREGIYVSGVGKVFSPQQKGVVLHSVKANFGNGTNQGWIPVSDAFVDSAADINGVRLNLGLPYDSNKYASDNDVFEVQILGIPPRSSQIFTVCGPVENLGTLQTPSLSQLANFELGKNMPGMLYEPGVENLSGGLIGPATGFVDTIHWKIPPTDTCVQPVDRIDAGNLQCAKQCEETITAKYTLRVKKDSEVVSRSAFEGQFQSTSFYQQTSPDQIKQLINVDLLNAAQKLLDQAAGNISFQAQ